MTLVQKIDGVTISNRIRVTSNQAEVTWPGVAWYGEPGITGITFDDPTGDLDLLRGWHTYTADETDCVGHERIFGGWIITRKISRGRDANRVSAARIWDCEIIDFNAAFGFETFRSAAQGIRPFETDIVRITAALSSQAFDGTPVHDNGRFATTNPINLTDNTYVGSYAVDMFTDAASIGGKNYYAYWDDSADEISLHYDLVGEGPSAGFAVSNVSTEINGSSTVYGMRGNAEQTQDPAGQYTGVLLFTPAGNVYGRNQTLIDSLSPSEFSPSEFRRDLVLRTDRIRRAATAATYLTQSLEIHSHELQTLRFTVRVSASLVNLAMQGDIIQVKFTHLPDFDTPTDVVIVRRTVRWNADNTYTIDFECTNNASSTFAPGGDPGDLPVPGCLPALVQDHEEVIGSTTLDVNGSSFDAAPTEDNLLVVWVLTRDVATTCTPDGFTAMGTGWQDDPATGGGHKANGERLFYKFAGASEPALVTFTVAGGNKTQYVKLMEWSNVDQFDGLSTFTEDTDQTGDPMFFGGGPVSPLTNRSVLLIGTCMPSLNVNDTWNPHSTDGFAVEAGVPGEGGVSLEAKGWIGYKAGTGGPTAGTETFALESTPSGGISRGSAFLIAAFSGDCQPTPLPGQKIENEFVADGDGSTTTFTTDFPYATGSLHVFVDGVEIIHGLTETDPEAGTFTLDFAPLGATGDTRAERVTATYQVSP